MERGSFKGSIGFVMAAAASAVGLGNIWRFPYLAARDGGGLFLVVYLILLVTFGFALLTTEVAIGRKTKQSPLTAYGKINKNWKWIGFFACLVPFIIMPYYCVIGGWVIKYMITFITGHGLEAAGDDYFTGFITSDAQPMIFLVIFLIICAAVVYRGVRGGIERCSKILMPILIFLVLGIAVFSLFITNTDASGNTVTGIDGLKVYLIPNFEGLTVKGFFQIVMDATSQLFFSLSVAMGIMVAYGSYVHDDANMSSSINKIEIFDTLVAFLAGMMIIPAVYVFSGVEGMSAGPSLMFISLPKIFAQMGVVGGVIGAVFFVMVLFAAVTSAMSILEAVVSSFIDCFHWSRKKATIVETCIALVLGLVVCLGYNKWYFEMPLPNGSVGQILDLFDYLSNNILMPIVSIGTCIFIGWIMKPKMIIDEVTKNGEHFGRQGLYVIMVKYCCPVLLTILLVMSLGII